MSCRNCGFVLEPQPQNINSSDNLVSQILRGQRPLFDSDDALLNAEIVELERLQSLYAAQLEEIQSRKHAVLKALANRKSIYAPIRSLPRDILIEIFDSVCDFWWQEADDNWGLRQRRDSLDVSGPLWVLGRVCGLWRDTLHSSPAWAQKLIVRGRVPKHALEILRTYLERTGEHLLDLKIIFGGREEDEGILPLLVQSSHRWKNLTIVARKHHMRHLESISHFSALQTIRMNIRDDYDYFRVCLRAPRLWKACLADRNHQIRLLPGITHFFGCITCPEDLHFLSQLPNLRRCRPVMNQAAKGAPVVTMAHLTHLYADMNALDVLSAPLLGSLVASPLVREQAARPSIILPTRISPPISSPIEMSSREFEHPATRVFALEACSTISRLKFEIHPQMGNFDIVEVLTSPSVLPNLHHLILYMSRLSGDQWTTVLCMVRSRRDAGMLKLVEIHFTLEDEHDPYLAEGMRALIQDDFEMRFIKRHPFDEDPLAPWHLI
ncbi:hypothetical protein EDD18DRAFT_1353157 [Armillaria luteobubalina]|uniref:F-box domain-containing protein n=1 Tax=Armillaria luteobubalina TaxID=153913 RepID=A0AA39Q536_9AGAR|nr:hypothetical protein EDD18DRAFT_1353157 [Armillaria luteobubalina]